MTRGLRFIPGYAGNAGVSYFNPARSSVYPRLRGERAHDHSNRTGTPGLSPATRGTLDESQPDRMDLRFIPGYAGNARASVLLMPLMAVYPRLRGERIGIGSTGG